MADVDLYVSKSAYPSPVAIGEPVTYTIIAANNGPDDTSSAELTDNLPPDVYLADITISQGDYCYKDDVITWNIGTLNSGASATMTVTVIPITQGTISNTATINSTDEDDEDDNPSNNAITTPVTVLPSVDLILIKESCPTTTTIGSTINYSIVVINNGPSPASNVIFTDILPTGIDANSIQVETSHGIPDIAGNTVTIELGSLDVNDKAVIRISAIATTEGVLTNTAEIKSDEVDTNPENNQATASTIVLSAADVSITKTASSEVLVLGDNLTYNLKIENHGPSTATNITVLDHLPENVTLISVNQSQGTSNIAGDPLVFDIGTLPPGGIANIEIEIKPKLEGMYVNSAMVSAVEEDPNKCNNSASVCVFVRKLVSTDISVQKSHHPEIVGLCTPITYTLKVTNHGPVSATGVTLVDQLPSSVKILSITSSQGRCCICNNSGCCGPDHCHDNHDEKEKDCCNEQEICTRTKEIICQLGTLAVGASAIVEISVIPKLLGEIINTAIVTANEADLDTTNNEAMDTVNVISTCEQVEYLIAKIEEFIISGVIAEKFGKVLISILRCSKQFICCNNPREAKKKLNEFTHKITSYIQKGYITEEQGCYLLSIAGAIVEELNCCNTCNCEEDCEEDKNC